jgi:hypothetical protein
MPTYTVHAPPPRENESVANPERFRFVRDGFHFWAFLVSPLWLLLHRLWLVLLLYVVVTGAINVGLFLIAAPASVKVLASLIVALLVGFEAGTLERWTLSRRRWSTLGFVIGDDRETAERRFFAEWAKHAGSPPPLPQAVAAQTAVPARPVAGPDVIGLFPEPGSLR